MTRVYSSGNNAKFPQVFDILQTPRGSRDKLNQAEQVLFTLHTLERTC